MSAEITLPRLAGTRAVADALVDTADLDGSKEVIVYARAVASAAQSFADEFVRALDRHGVDTVRIVGSSTKLMDYLTSSSSRLGGKVTVSAVKSDDLALH